MTVTGSCLCGAVRWQSTAPPITTRVCWCRDCQYLGAGSGTVGACFRTEAFSIVGETSSFSSIADSGNRMHRRFCPVCGTPLFSEAEARPHLIFVRVGTFDDPDSDLGKYIGMRFALKLNQQALLQRAGAYARRVEILYLPENKQQLLLIGKYMLPKGEVI